MQPDAVIFDWGGTLTRWHDIDFHAESLALAHAVVASEEHVDVHVDVLQRANQVIWGRSRDHQQSATVADLFTEAGLEHDPDLLGHYREFWEPHTATDKQVAISLCDRNVASIDSENPAGVDHAFHAISAAHAFVFRGGQREPRITCFRFSLRRCSDRRIFRFDVNRRRRLLS